MPESEHIGERERLQETLRVHRRNICDYAGAICVPDGSDLTDEVNASVRRLLASEVRFCERAEAELVGMSTWKAALPLGLDDRKETVNDPGSLRERIEGLVSEIDQPKNIHLQGFARQLEDPAKATDIMRTLSQESGVLIDDSLFVAKSFYDALAEIKDEQVLKRIFRALNFFKSHGVMVKINIRKVDSNHNRFFGDSKEYFPQSKENLLRSIGIYMKKICKLLGLNDFEELPQIGCGEGLWLFFLKRGLLIGSRTRMQYSLEIRKNLPAPNIDHRELDLVLANLFVLKSLIDSEQIKLNDGKTAFVARKGELVFWHYYDRIIYAPKTGCRDIFVPENFEKS